MNRVLEANLKHARRFYQNIELTLCLHLSVADKSGLIAHLKQTDHTCFSDLWGDTTRYLWEMGYRSKRFEELMQNRKQVDSYWAHVLKPSE